MDYLERVYSLLLLAPVLWDYVIYYPDFVSFLLLFGNEGGGGRSEFLFVPFLVVIGVNILGFYVEIFFRIIFSYWILSELFFLNFFYRDNFYFWFN